MLDVKDVGLDATKDTTRARRSLATPIIVPSGKSTVMGTLSSSTGILTLRSRLS